MNGFRPYVLACCGGSALAAVLIAGMVASSSPALSRAQNNPLPSNSTLGAHTLLAQSEGSGTTPAVTAPITTQASGSSLIVFNGGYSANSAPPVDSYSNRWKPVAAPVRYGNGYGDRFDVKAYIALAAKGGPGHTVSIVKSADPAGEISIPFVEIKNAGVLQDVAQSYPAPGLVMTSGSVSTTGPATLIALWWGDGAVKRMTAVPRNGFTSIDSFLHLPDNSGVQCAVAFRHVSKAGTYNVSWMGTPVQGAILWLFAFQTKRTG